VTRSELTLMQALPTTLKVEYAKEKIREWYEHWNGQVYVSFSGGKDSTVLLHLVRMLYPEVPAVFVDTGLEYPEIREFVRTKENVIWLKPKMGFKAVLDKYGYPVVSKEVSMAVSRCLGTKSLHQRELRAFGGINENSGRAQTVGVVPKKYRALLLAPFKVSEKCCDVMKKQPLKRYEKEACRKPFVGVMPVDSRGRMIDFLSSGCNAFEKANPQSRPLSIFTEADIWKCLRSGLPYSSIYDKGVDRTGCVFCMFGIARDKDRFKNLEKTHPQLHSYCMNQLGMRDVLAYLEPLL